MSPVKGGNGGEGKRTGGKGRGRARVWPPSFRSASGDYRVSCRYLGPTLRGATGCQVNAGS